MIILFWVNSAYGKSALLVLRVASVPSNLFSDWDSNPLVSLGGFIYGLNLYTIYHTHHDDAPKTEGIHDQPHLVP